MAQADSRVIARTEEQLAILVQGYLPTLYNVSTHGQAKLAASLQGEARKTLDFDLGKAYALWMMGAWLEAKNLPGADADAVFDSLSKIIQALDSSVTSRR